MHARLYCVKMGDIRILDIGHMGFERLSYRGVACG